MKPPLEERELLYASTRKQWREWLRKNHSAKKEIWLVYYKKHSNKIRIPYNDAVEEALCFGWIDSTVRTIDENKYAQRFSPRKAGSAYSQSNIERLHALIKQKKVIKSVLDKLPKLPSVQSKAPDDIIESIKLDEKAWKNFQKLSDSYKRIRIAFIDGARKRPREFEKRLRYFIKMTARNKLFGFGGIDKYY
jgi:uncharacterized protein YdeI (YjbR/CyaY-like superfamily)